MTLHQHGADLFLADAHGRTPLFMSCSNGVVEMASLLIELDPSASENCDSHGDTPLHAAVRNSHADIVALLLERCPRLLHAENGDGCSATLLAQNRGEKQIEQQLRDWGGVSESYQAQSYGPRWSMLLDETSGHVYYVDNWAAEGEEASTWERPEGFDGTELEGEDGAAVEER